MSSIDIFQNGKMIKNYFQKNDFFIKNKDGKDECFMGKKEYKRYNVKIKIYKKRIKIKVYKKFSINRKKL